MEKTSLKTENWTKFPKAYPFTSENTGITYTKAKMSSLYKLFQYKLKGLKVDPDHFNVEIAECILKFMRYYKPDMGASAATYASMLCRQFLSRKGRSVRNKPNAPMFQDSYDDTLYIHDEQALCPSPDSRLSDVDFFYYVLKNEGHQMETIARMKAYAIPDKEISESLGIGVRSVVRKKKILREMFDQYVQQNT